MSAQWFDGLPPSIGWWPASVFENQTVLRWWNGRCWSVPVPVFCNAVEAGKKAEFVTTIEHHEFIRWTDRPESWPEWSKT